MNIRVIFEGQEGSGFTQFNSLIVRVKPRSNERKWLSQGDLTGKWQADHPSHIFSMCPVNLAVNLQKESSGRILKNADV